MNNQNLPWQRFGIEAMVIVISILLAFSIEAWWQDRQQREEEKIILRALLSDLNSKRGKLTENQQFNREILDYSETLLSATVGSTRFEDSRELDRAIFGSSFQNQAGGWGSAPLNSIMAGGKISLISNPKLLQELAALEARFELVETFHANDTEFCSTQYIPFLRDNTNMLQMTALFSSPPGLNLDYGFPPITPAEQRDHSYLLSNNKFQNLLIDGIYWIMDIMNIGYLGLDADLVRIIQMIEAELEIH